MRLGGGQSFSTRSIDMPVERLTRLWRTLFLIEAMAPTTLSPEAAAAMGLA
jgi:hypothetical protein